MDNIPNLVKIRLDKILTNDLNTVEKPSDKMEKLEAFYFLGKDQDGREWNFDDLLCHWIINFSDDNVHIFIDTDNRCVDINWFIKPDYIKILKSTRAYILKPTIKVFDDV